MEVDILLIFDWRDGPLEGVLRRKGESACWYFKLVAQRFEVSTLDDRLFGLWTIPDSDCSVLIDEFGDADAGTHVWPVSGGIGSVTARQVVAGLLSAERVMPTLIIRTSDFVEVLGVWDVVRD